MNPYDPDPRSVEVPDLGDSPTYYTERHPLSDRVIALAGLAMLTAGLVLIYLATRAPV